MKWIKASERSPEPKPEMDNNREYSFHCRHDGKRVVLYFWSFNWWGERYDGEIYGVSEKVFNQLEWLDESHPEQGEVYKWVKASERLPEETVGYAEDVVYKVHLDSGVRLRVSTINQFLDTVKYRIKENFEWLCKLSSPPPEGQDERVKKECINFMKWYIESDYCCNAAGNFFKDGDIVDISYTIQELYEHYLLIKK